MGGKPISVKKLKKELGRYPQPTRSEQPCPIPPKDALDTIIARTPPATLSFDTKFITSATVPWFLFYDTFIPTVTSTFKHMGEGDAQQFALAKQTSSLAGDLFGTHFSLSTVAELITEKLPKRLSADDLQTKSLAPGNFIQILCWVVYQSSNSLLSDLQTDNFLQWIIDHGNMRILRQFTRVKCPATTVLKANLLLGAIRLGNTKTVQFLLNDGTNPEIIHRISRETALQLAIKARFDNAEIVELLLKHGASPNASMTVRLIGAGADINRPAKVPFETNGKVLETPLQIAIRMRSIRLINILLDSHADVNYWEESMQFGSALNLAVFLRDRELVQLLLSRGADPNKTMSLVAAIPDIGQTADLKIFRLLLDHKADVNPQCLETPPLQPSAGLQEPTSTTAARWLRLTPLQAALERGHVDLAWMFLDAGADCRAPAFWGAGKTALQAAVMNGNMTFVEYFVRRGVNINACPATNNGATALQFAAIQGHYNVVVFLLENGADVNAPKATRGGRTALEGAAEHGRLDIVHLLLENDQEEESLGQRCEEAAVLAERNGHFVIAEILRGWKKP
ncbi:hypothetical protein N0V84_003377 [Fusarium piperis]|uniref:Ankyrin n=1 Tax=Fusarium piperis TaxID=1435070 RepID=A0A9W8WHK0_9HYPO|nr:hypothetical protein N0V84_003377 [Fusarium piperis]